MIVDPDKKTTKRGLFRTLFSPFMGANIRRARIAGQDARDARGRLATQRSLNADVKDLRKRGILK